MNEEVPNNTVIEESPTANSSANNDAPVSQASAFQALARKYRPQKFSQMVGQDVLVTTLCNALKTGRMHHAFMLTGVRGTGKTTTARIIAKAVNCIGRDVTQNPDPCGICESCRAISHESSMDVVEIDAASHTGVNDMRDIIESVKYRPIAGQCKIYIIDEVHMLSKSAFNALLKTLEEPPDYVKFIFATTEIQKVPVTILSRCQHLELLRVSQKTLADYFATIINKENLTAEADALIMIALAADGSVRDGQSLLDQAISLAGDGSIDGALVANMLRLNDQTHIYQLLDDCFSAQPHAALALLETLYQKGGVPEMIVRDLLNGVYWLTRLHLSPDLSDNLALPESLRGNATIMAQKLDMPRLTRIWQILQQGAAELLHSPVKQQSVEMLMLKLCYASGLPDPSSLITMLQSDTETKTNMHQAVSSPPPLSSPLPAPPSADITDNDAVKKKTELTVEIEAEPVEAEKPLSAEPIQPSKNVIIPEFQQYVERVKQANEARLAFILYEQLICTAFELPNITLAICPSASGVNKDAVSKQLQQFLRGNGDAIHWDIHWHDDAQSHDFISLHQYDLMLDEQQKQQMAQRDFIKQALQLFPNASIMAIEDNADANNNNEGTAP
ncbi:MAG: DNA polymerase III subunit gamma/tau [Alphaproteobacteria bacterium]|nr:DNA polymerase III subunit gamma/tau [Alphaproteobacteria bacterium]